jgi:hypothetical protein
VLYSAKGVGIRVYHTSNLPTIIATKRIEDGSIHDAICLPTIIATKRIEDGSVHDAIWS